MPLRSGEPHWLVSFTIAPLGIALIGPLPEQIGRTSTLKIAVTVTVLGVATSLSVPKIRELRQTKDGALIGWREHQVAGRPVAAGE